MSDDQTKESLGHRVAFEAIFAAKALGIDLPDWAYNAIVKNPEHVGVISDAVCVQAGLIQRDAFIAEAKPWWRIR